MKFSDEKISGFSCNIRYDNSQNASVRLWDDSRKDWTSRFQVKTKIFDPRYL